MFLKFGDAHGLNPPDLAVPIGGLWSGGRGKSTDLGGQTPLRGGRGKEGHTLGKSSLGLVSSSVNGDGRT